MQIPFDPNQTVALLLAGAAAVLAYGELKIGLRNTAKTVDSHAEDIDKLKADRVSAAVLATKVEELSGDIRKMGHDVRGLTTGFQEVALLVAGIRSRGDTQK